jgi:hypothetical protein
MACHLSLNKSTGPVSQTDLLILNLQSCCEHQRRPQSAEHRSGVSKSMPSHSQAPGLLSSKWGTEQRQVTEYGNPRKEGHGLAVGQEVTLGHHYLHSAAHARPEHLPQSYS